jgi:lysophospholipase L1-like esterase
MKPKITLLPSNIMLFLFFMAVALFLGSDPIYSQEADQDEKQAPSSSLSPVLSQEGAQSSESERRPIVMLGDSLTAGGSWGQMDAKLDIVNHGIPSDGYDDILLRLQRTIELNPRKVFLQVGINDIARGETFVEASEGQREIWHQLRTAIPDVEIIVCSLLPMRDKNNRWNRNYNQLIEEYNVLLSKMTVQEGLQFVDLFSAFVGPDGCLPESFTFDGLHLTSAGYQIWYQTVKPWLNN